jgi:hypothetical protein
MKKVLVAALIALMGTSANANATFSGQVLRTGLYGDGTLFIVFTGMANIAESGCTGHARVHIPPSHARIKEFLALAMTALSSGTNLAGGTTGCSGGVPTIDSTASGWLTLGTP